MQENPVQTQGSPSPQNSAPVEGLDAVRLPKIDKSVPYRVSPPVGVGNPNRTNTFPSMAVNGIRMTDDSITEMGELLALKRGHDVLVIPNPTEGTLEDMAHCVVAAFSDEKGVFAEKSAAWNLASNLVQRLNDSEPIVIDAYSQGTLIVRNVLAFVRAHLIGQGREDDWNSLASRLKIQTYGAAVRRWPKGVENVVEFRHSGDPVAMVGGIVSANKTLRDLLECQLGSRSKVVVIHQLTEAHSIEKYLQNNPRFLVSSLKGNTAEERAKEISQSMAQGELSNFEYSRTMSYLVRVARSDTLPIGRTNNAILMLRGLLSELQQDPTISPLLSAEMKSLMEGASQLETRKKPNPAERRQHPGRYRFN